MITLCTPFLRKYDHGQTIRELTFEMSCCMIGADVEDQLKEKNILSIHREHHM